MYVEICMLQRLDIQVFLKMSHFCTKVVVPKRERKATERGGRKGAILVKATLFTKCWSELKDKKQKYVNNHFMSIAEKYKNIVGGNNDEVVEQAIGDMFKGLFSQPKRMSYFRSFEQMGSNLMFCNDETIKSNIIQYIRTHEQVKSITHIKNIFNDVYLGLYAIGRERKWCDQEIILPDYGNGVPVLNAGNPLTKEVEGEVCKEFNHLAKKRPSRLTVQVDKGDISSDDDEQDDDKKTIRLEKQGLPASIAMVHYVVMKLLVKLFDMILRFNDVRRMENMVLLIMLWTFTMHEAARPGDTMFGSHHKNLIFWFGNQYPLLTLAFVKIETLEYLLKGNHIRKLYFESWKGKKVRDYRGRWHCFLPCEYNCLDMAWMYVVMMRALAFVSPTSITSKIFYKTTTNLSEIRRTTNKSMNIFNLVMYSIRYAFAEESTKYLLEIPRNWVRYVMGHFANSHMSQRYANNLNQRVEIENIKTLLGCDVCNEISINDELPLRFRTAYTGMISDVPADVPKHILDDLNEVKKAINKAFSNESGTIANSAVLMERVPKSKIDFMAEMKRIPFGTHIMFKDGLLSDSVNEKLNRTWMVLHKMFGKADIIGQTKHVVWSYGQVMFGEWHNDEKAKAIQEYKEYKEQKTRVAMDYVIASTELPFPKTKKRKNHDVKPQTTIKVHKKPKANTTTSVPIIPQCFDMFSAKHIEVGDIIAIVCSSRDKWSIQVPNTSKFVWVCSVEDVKVMTHKVRVVGKFFKGTIDELVFDHNSNKVVNVCDDDLAHILTGIQNVEWFQFEDDEIKQIIGFCQ